MKNELIEEVWKSQTPVIVNAQVVASQSIHRQKRLRLALLGEVVGGSFAVSLAAWFVATIPGPITVSLLVVCIVVSFVSLLNQVTLNRSIANVRETVSNHLERRQREVREELIFITRGVGLWMFTAIVLVPWAIWVAIANMDAYIKSPGSLILGIGGILLILFFSFRALRKKKNRLKDEESSVSKWLSEYQGHQA